MDRSSSNLIVIPSIRGYAFKKHPNEIFLPLCIQDYKQIVEFMITSTFKEVCPSKNPTLKDNQILDAFIIDTIDSIYSSDIILKYSLKFSQIPKLQKPKIISNLIISFGLEENNYQSLIKELEEIINPSSPSLEPKTNPEEIIDDKKSELMKFFAKDIYDQHGLSISDFVKSLYDGGLEFVKNGVKTVLELKKNTTSSLSTSPNINNSDLPLEPPVSQYSDSFDPPIEKRVNSISKGLINNGNTCYMNCLLQILAHCLYFQSKSTDPLMKSLFALLSGMRNLDIGNVDKELNEFHRNLSMYTDEYEIGCQRDVKSLFAFILSTLDDNKDIAANVFIWKKKKHFSCFKHPQFKISMPDSKNLYQLIKTDYFKKVTIQIIAESFKILITPTSSEMFGECIHCGSNNIRGNEIVSETIIAKYIAFVISSADGVAKITDIERVQIKNFTLNLKGISVVNGVSRASHTFAICKEKSVWFTFNDSYISTFEASSDIKGIYMLFYEVE